MLREKGNALCLGCHGPNSPIGPFADSIPAHTHHKLDSAGSQCVSCHMPLIEETLKRMKVTDLPDNFAAEIGKVAPTG